MEPISSQIAEQLNQHDLTAINVPKTTKHPKSEEIFAFTNLKIKRYLGPQYKLSFDLAECNFYAFPLIENLGMASFFVIYNLCCFMLNDHLDLQPEDVQKWINSLHLKIFPGNGVLEKWWQFMVIVGRETIGNTELNELLKVTIDCLIKLPELAKCWRGEITPSDKKLLDVRYMDCGVPYQLYVLQIDSKLSLTDELKTDENWLAFNRFATINMMLINELYSLKKEIKENSFLGNYVCVKMRNGGISAQDSVNKVAIEAKESENMAYELGNLLIKRNNANLTRYVNSVFATITGSHYWSSICKRYNQI